MKTPKSTLTNTMSATCKRATRCTAASTSILLVVLLAACSPSASDALREGKAYAEKGDFASATISFKNAVQKSPESLPARLALAEALENGDDLSAAEQQYRRALDLGGNANELVPRIAVLLLDRGDLPLLIKDFGQRKLSDEKADADLRGILALAHFSLNQATLANAQLDGAKVTTAAVHLARAQSALMGKRREDARSELDAALAAKQVPWWVWRAASRMFAALNDNDKSFTALQHAYELAPQHRGVIGEYAERLIAAGRSADAKPLREKLNKIAPGYFRTQYVEALYMMEEGKFDEAWTLATKIIAKLPEHMPAHLIAATVELQRGELASADARLAKILSHNPNAVGGLRLRTYLELQRGNLKAADSALAQALKITPNDKELLALAAQLNWAKGDKTGAIKQMEIAARTTPPQAQLHARLGEMYQAMNKKAEAHAAIDKAVELASTDTKHRDEVFRTLFRMRLIDKATAMAKAEAEGHPKDPEPLLWMAAVLGSEGKEAEAFEQTRHALDLRADYYPALAACAMLAKSAPDRVTEFENRLQKAIDAGSKDARVYSERARRLRLAGADAEKIGETYTKGLAADPTSIKLREEAVRFWLTRDRKDKALGLAKEGEAALPDNPLMLALAASTQEAVGEMQQATQKFGQLASRYPDRIDWNIAYAQALVHAGKASEAISVLRKLINQRPDEPATYDMLARLQLREGKLADAEVTAAMLRDRPKQGAAGWLLLGDVYGKTDRRTEALKAYGEAGKAGAVEAAVLRKVELLDKTGGSGLANGELKGWLTAHPDSISAHFLAARRENARQDFDAAASHLEAIVKIEPKNVVALNDLAWAYAKIRNPASLETAKKAVALAPENPTILDTLAEAQRATGQRNDAIATLQRILSGNPAVPFVRIHLAELLIEDGKKKEADDLLKNLDERKLDQETAQRLERIRKPVGTKG